MPEGPVIELRGVTKTYDGRRILSPTSLSVPEGCAHVLVGPSGCGKSTLLRIVMGLIHPDSGTVSVAGEPMTAKTALRLRHCIGYVIQDGGLFPHLTAEENVTLVASHLQWPAERIRKRLGELAALAGFPEDGLRRYPAQLSGGQRQRVGVMRALMLDPPVLLMDEPLGALDPIIRARLQTDLKRIFRELRKTVLVVTHDMGEAAYLGDVISVIREGQIVQTAPFRTLVEAPAEPYVAEFIHAQRQGWTAEGTEDAQ